MTITLVRDSEGAALDSLVMIVDMSERHQVEAALRASEERFFKAFNLSPDPMAISALADGLIEVNGQNCLITTTHDITERRRAEAALRVSEDRCRDLIENSGLIIGMHDLEGNILSLNQSFISEAGYEQAEELLGIQLSDLLAPGVRHLFPAYLEKIRRTGRAHGLMKIVTPSGEERILEYDNSVRREGLTTPIVRCFAHDVTEHKRAEAALGESEARLRMLGDNIPNGAIYQVGRKPDGTIYYPYMSAGIEGVLGVTAEEVMGGSRVIYDLIVEEDWPRFLSDAEESRRSLSIFDVEVRVRTRQGQLRWIRFRSTPRRLHDGGTLWDGVNVDVTESKRDLEALLQTVGAIIWEGEEDLAAQTDRFTFVSQQAVVLLGYPIKDWLEQPTFWSDHLHPEDRQRVLALRRQAIAAKRDYENISPRTVESHKYEMMETLGLEKTAELVQHAIKIGLVSVSPTPPSRSQ